MKIRNPIFRLFFGNRFDVHDIIAYAWTAIFLVVCANIAAWLNWIEDMSR